MATKMHGGAIKPLFNRARELRDQQTHAEEILWGYLKTKPLGFKFRRQHPYTVYIFDFYCHKLKLVVEVDGKVHSLPDVKHNDEMRQASIEAAGFTVLRFTNDEIADRIENVIEVLEKYIKNKMIND